MKTIGDRILHARKTANTRLGRTHQVTQSELGQYIGLAQSNVYALEQNRNKRNDIGICKLIRAAELLRCSFLWLATGKGEMTNIDTDIFSELQSGQGVPLFFPRYAKTRNDSDVQQYIGVSREIQQTLGKNAFFTLVSDNGLSPRAEMGDIVLIDPSVQVRVMDFVLVADPGYRLPVARQIIERSVDQFTLKPLNTMMPEQPLDEISQLIGVVIEIRHSPDQAKRIRGWNEDNRKAVSSNVIKLPVD